MDAIEMRNKAILVTCVMRRCNSMDDTISHLVYSMSCRFFFDCAVDIEYSDHHDGSVIIIETLLIKRQIWKFVLSGQNSHLIIFNLIGTRQDQVPSTPVRD